MRIALITLAVAALAFIGSIIWIFATKNGIDILPKSGVSSPSIKISDDTTNLELLRSQWKTEDRIKELEAKIDALSMKNQTIQSVGAPNNASITPESSGSDKVQSTNASTETTTSGSIVPISAKFLTKIITKVNLNLIKNNGIFGLYVFDTNNEYSTYSDPKYGITIVASRVPYSIWLKNWKSINSSIYSTNETKTFSFPSFYLNPLKDDNIIRLVLQVESQTLMISLPKAKYTEFKNLMLKK